MASERHTEQRIKEFSARLRRDPPFIAEECLRALNKVLSVKAE